MNKENIGARITKSAEIIAIANNGKTIYHSRMNRLIPAAFLQNMQFRTVAGYMRMGWLYEYKTPKKKR